jgi:hypothetical protein
MPILRGGMIVTEQKTSSWVQQLLAIVLCVGLIGIVSAIACGKGPHIVTDTREYSLEAGEKRVISIVLNKGDRLNFTVTVESNDIGVKVDDPSGQAAVAFTRVESGDFAVIAKEYGTYIVTFDNSYSSFTPKKITVDLEYPER